MLTAKNQDAVEALRLLHNSLHESEILLIEATSDFEILHDRNRSVKDLLATQTRRVDELAEQASKAQQEARRLINVCSGLLQNESDEELRTFLGAMPEGNGSVVRDFEARQKKIDSLSARLEEIRHALSELETRIQELRDQWEPELDSLVSKISTSFSFNMEQISCAGEVGVFKDEDFDQWAIHIRVKFRCVLFAFISPVT